MSEKYIIRNCELICNGECPNSKTGYCQDCTDCVMKKIVELCKEENYAWLAKEILSKLDIQRLNNEE